MELKQYLRMAIDDLGHCLKRVTDGLTQAEVEWRPACGCNSIGLILFHAFKTEDSFIQTNLKKKKELYESEKWYKKIGLDVKEEGAHYTVEQVNAFPVPKLKTILEYGAAVRANTLAYVDTLKAADFDKKIKMRFGLMPMAMVFTILIGHASQHIGEMSYLRGLQRGMDK